MKRAIDPEPSVYAEQWHPPGVASMARGLSAGGGADAVRPHAIAATLAKSESYYYPKKTKNSAPSPHYVRVGERGPSS